MVIFVGNISMKIGASDVSNVNVTNVEKLLWRETPQPSVKPITVINQVYPLGFHSGHRWIEGELHVKSEAKAAVHAQAVDYLPAGLASPICPYLIAAIVGHDAASWTIGFVNAVFCNEEFTHGHDEEAITIYRFVAQTAGLVAP